MTKSLGIGRGGARPGAGRKPGPLPVSCAAPDDMVEEMAALGEAPKVIARALSITYTQLQREYRDQLLRGSARLRAELIGLVWAKARAGNWQAIQWLLARMTAIEAEKRLAAEPKPAKLGKKERAHREAQTAGDGTEWGEDLAPAGGYPN